MPCFRHQTFWPLCDLGYLECLASGTRTSDLCINLGNFTWKLLFSIIEFFELRHCLVIDCNFYEVYIAHWGLYLDFDRQESLVAIILKFVCWIPWVQALLGHKLQLWNIHCPSRSMAQPRRTRILGGNYFQICLLNLWEFRHSWVITKIDYSTLYRGIGSLMETTMFLVPRRNMDLFKTFNLIIKRMGNEHSVPYHRRLEGLLLRQ